MQLNITGKNIEIGDGLRSHAERSLAAAVDKYFSGAIEASVVLSREAHLYRSDISVHVGRGISAHGHAEAADAAASLDLAVDHVAKQLRRAKRRRRDHHGPKGEE